MPVCDWNSSSVGITVSLEPLTLRRAWSMYSGQFDQMMAMSCADMSFAGGQLSASWTVPDVPQADSSPVPPRAASPRPPRSTLRRESPALISGVSSGCGRLERRVRGKVIGVSLECLRGVDRDMHLGEMTRNALLHSLDATESCEWGRQQCDFRRLGPRCR